MNCRICSNASGNRVLRVPEQMFRTGESFDYLECGACGSLHIVQIPDDLGRHYPAHYYSLATPKRRTVRQRLKDARARHRFKPSMIGGLLVKFFGPGNPEPWIAALDLPLDAPILDVGCGYGANLYRLERLGFTNLRGVDPYAPQHAHRAVSPEEFSRVEGQYRLITFHHSLEHLPDPFSALRRARSLLADHGRIMVRIPLAGTFAWREYGVHWVGLDAPRHLWLFSERAFAQTARTVGLEVRQVLYDSHALQFWGSELYRSGKPLSAGPSCSEEELQRMSARANALNEARDGDAACFVLSTA